jgi:PknH-like extracellular domain
MRIAAAAVSITLAVAAGLAVPVVLPVAGAHPSDPGVVSYAVLGKGSVGNIVGGPMGWESVFTRPVQEYWVELPVCNNWADIGLPEVYDDPDLASFNGATTQTSATDQTHFVKQAVGVFATNDAAGRAFHRVVDRTVGCSGQTTAMHLDNGTTQVWSFAGGPPTATDADWTKQEAGTDRRCFNQIRLRENVLLQAKVCQSGNAGPAVNVLAGAMQNALGQ